MLQAIAVVDAMAPDTAAPAALPLPAPAVALAEEDAAADHPPQKQETASLDAAIAPFLLLSMLMPSQAATAPTAPTHTPDPSEGQPSQAPGGATATPLQALSTPLSGTRLNDAMRDMPRMSLPEGHAAILSVAVPTPADVDPILPAGTALAAVAGGTPAEGRPATVGEGLALHTETAPRVAETSARHQEPQASATAYPSVAYPPTGEPDSPAGAAGAGPAHALALEPSPSTPTATATPPALQTIPTQEDSADSDVPLPHAAVVDQPSALTMGAAGHAEAAVDPGFSTGDQHDPPPGNDLHASFAPRPQRPESPETPVGYADATQRASLMHDAPATTTHPGPTDQRGVHVEPTPVITQLIDRLHVAAKDGPQALSVQLTPENLGTVRVDIVAEQLEVHARLLVDNPAVKETLEANLPQLREALQAQGLHVQDLSVAIGQHALQQDSMGGHLSHEERLWRAPRGFTGGEPMADVPAAPGRTRSSADLRQVDLFV
jgi:flagellar hook-length control protein FliK